MKIAMEKSHKVIPKPEPCSAFGKPESGGYIVQPDMAGPEPSQTVWSGSADEASPIWIPNTAPSYTKREANINIVDKKKNQ